MRFINFLKKNWIKILITILVLVIVIELTYCGGAKKISGLFHGKAKTEKAIVLETARDTAIYVFAYKEGQASLADSLTMLNDLREQLKDCPKYKRTIKAPTKKASPKAESKTDAFVPPPAKPAVAISSGAAVNTASAMGVIYKPRYVGDVGTTLIQDGEYYHPVYYIKKSVYNQNNFTTAVCSAAINKGSDEVMTPYEDYLIYIDFSIELNSRMIEDAYWNFSIYMGDYNINGSSYKKWYPHEIIKPMLKQYLGREYGEITDDNMKTLAPYNDGIANGYFRPNGVFSPPDSFNHKYEGWEIQIKMNYFKESKK